MRICPLYSMQLEWVELKTSFGKFGQIRLERISKNRLLTTKTTTTHTIQWLLLAHLNQIWYWSLWIETGLWRISLAKLRTRWQIMHPKFLLTQVSGLQSKTCSFKWQILPCSLEVVSSPTAIKNSVQKEDWQGEIYWPQIANMIPRIIRIISRVNELKRSWKNLRIQSSMDSQSQMKLVL